MMKAIVVFSLLTSMCNALGELEGHVVGGYFANIQQFPFMACLSMTAMTESYSAGWKCGATILNQRLLLTAAHCLKTEHHEPEIAIASVGNTNHLKGATYLVLKYVVHEDYDVEANTNDIALAFLNGSLTFGRNVARVILMRQPPKSKSAELVGWGMIEDYPPRRTNLLKSAKLRIWPTHDCKEFMNANQSQEIEISVLCTGELDELANRAAKGDSGGPLIVKKKIVIGIVSYAIPSWPGITLFTDTQFYFDWIQQQAAQLFCTV